MINTFLITGATKGLGRAIALHLASLNNRVYAIGRTSELLENLVKVNSSIQPICADITYPDGIEKIASSVSNEKSFSIIQNAAVAIPRLFINDENSALLKKQIETNLIAPLALTKRLLPFLEGQRILYVSSQAANLVLPGLMPYCISKLALEHSARCLNAELAEKKIYFSILYPGMLDTQMQNTFRDSKLIDLPEKDFYVQSFIEKKLRDPHEVAKFVSWIMLKTDDATYINNVWDINLS